MFKYFYLLRTHWDHKHVHDFSICLWIFIFKRVALVCLPALWFSPRGTCFEISREQCLNCTSSKKIIAKHYLGLITVPKAQPKNNTFLNIEKFGQNWQQWLLKAASGLISVKLHSVSWSFHEQDLNGSPTPSL